jgi:hypothetical protein
MLNAECPIVHFTYDGLRFIMTRMIPEPFSIKRVWAARRSWNAWLEALIAGCLIALGVGGVLLAMQSHPYLGEAASDLAAVPARVVAAPNVPALTGFVAALGLGLTGAAWFIARLIHGRFFAPVAARRVWRQAIFVGVSGLVLAWLKINQALTLPLAAVIVIGFVLAEVYLSLRSVPQSKDSA